MAERRGSDMSEQELEELETYGREKVDLTLEQADLGDEDGIDEMDDFDLLEATIDPTDVKSLQKKYDLEADIEYEQYFIKTKLVFKLAMSESNPMKVNE